MTETAGLFNNYVSPDRNAASETIYNPKKAGHQNPAKALSGAQRYLSSP